MRFALLLLAGLLFISMIGQSRADLPPEGQAAEHAGFIAAKNQDWELAIQKFQEARVIAPDAPELFKNLGLAESKIPERELRAIAWFGAYLAAATNAPDKAAVNDLIITLQIRNRTNLSRLIKTVQNAAGNFSGEDREDNLSDAADLWARYGDINEAARIAGRIHDPDLKKLNDSAIAQAKADAAIAAKPQVPTLIPVIAVSDWLDVLTDSDSSHECALNTDPFLNLDSYLADQHSDDPHIFFNALTLTAKKIISAEKTIDRMMNHPEFFTSAKAEQLLISGNNKEPRGDRDGAIADYNTAIVLKPDFADAYYYRGIAKSHKGYSDDATSADFYHDIDGAIADFDKAIELVPNYPEAFYQRGLTESDKADHYDLDSSRYDDQQAGNDWNSAIADYTRAIELKPDYVDAYMVRGMVKGDTGDWDGARLDYTKALEIKPDFGEASIALQDLNWETNQNSEAPTNGPPTVAQRLQQVEHHLTGAVPNFEPVKSYGTVEERMEAIEHRLVQMNILQLSTNDIPPPIELRLENIEAAMKTLPPQADGQNNR